MQVNELVAIIMDEALEPRDRLERIRVRLLASLPSNPEHDTYGAPPVGALTDALDRMDALLDPSRYLLSVKDESATAKASRADMALIRAALAAAPAPADKCATCNDNGMIGGPSFYAPDEGGVPCPDCTPAPSEAVKGVSTAEPTPWGWLRNHYQDYTTVGETADAMERAFRNDIPAFEVIAEPEGLQGLHGYLLMMASRADLDDAEVIRGWARAIERLSPDRQTFASVWDALAAPSHPPAMPAVAVQADPERQGLFDNRATCCREAYNKGQKVASVTAEALLHKGVRLGNLHRDWLKPWGTYPDLAQQAAQSEHLASADCWCEPEIDYVDPDTGATVYVHKGKQ